MKDSKTFRINILPVLVLAVPVLPAQQAAPPLSAIELQKASVAKMMDSISKQRASVSRQIGQSPSDGFFTLPPPPRTPRFTPPPCPALPDMEVSALVENAARREALDPALIRGVMQQESAFRPCAVSPKGAQGLMQLMPETAAQLGVLDPFNPASNVNGGAKFLRQLLNRYSGNLMFALSAYNAGPGQVDAAGGVPAIPETVNYVNQIMGNLPNLIAQQFPLQ